MGAAEEQLTAQSISFRRSHDHILIGAGWSSSSRSTVSSKINMLTRVWRSYGSLSNYPALLSPAARSSDNLPLQIAVVDVIVYMPHTPDRTYYVFGNGAHVPSNVHDLHYYTPSQYIQTSLTQIQLDYPWVLFVRSIASEFIASLMAR